METKRIMNISRISFIIIIAFLWFIPAHITGLLCLLLILIAGSYEGKKRSLLFAVYSTPIMLIESWTTYGTLYRKPLLIGILMYYIIGFFLGSLFEKRLKQRDELYQEIERRKELEKEIMESEQDFRSIISAVPDIVIFLNSAGIYLDVWTGREENLINSRDELIGKNFENIIPEKVAQKIRYYLDRVLEKNTLEEFEYKLKVLGGKKWFEARMTATSKDKAVMVIRDITERKKTEKELEVQRAYFKRLFDSSPEAIAIVDNQERVARINKGFKDLFYYNEEEAKGEYINDLIVPSEFREGADAYSNQVLTGEIVNEESIRMRKDGSKINVAMLGYPINFNDQKLGIYVIYRDITERKKLENNLRESKKKIEKLHAISIKMEGCQEKEEIYQLTVDSAEEILNFDVSCLDIVKEDKFMVKAVSSGVPENGYKSSPITEGIAGKAYRNQTTYLTGDISKEKEARPVKEGYKSSITVPIGKYGVFQVISNQLNGFDESDKEMAELLISHTSAALKRLESEEKLREYATYDPLTGVYNRRVGLTILEEKMKTADRKKTSLTVCFLDINDLKPVNDNYGHKIGDELIVKTTDVINSQIRVNDSLVRLGGDEFLIIFPDCTEKKADNVWERISNRFKEINCKEDRPYNISVSHGFAEYNNKKTINMDELISIADERMYREKKRYKGCN